MAVEAAHKRDHTGQIAKEKHSSFFIYEDNKENVDPATGAVTPPQGKKPKRKALANITMQAEGTQVQGVRSLSSYASVGLFFYFPSMLQKFQGKSLIAQGVMGKKQLGTSACQKFR